MSKTEAAFKAKVKGWQYYLIVSAYLAVSEQPESKLSALEKKILYEFRMLVAETTEMNERLKDEVRKGNENKPLDGAKIFSRAKDYKSEITNVVVPLWNSHCTPSGTSSQEQSFELLRTKYWLVKKTEAYKEKVKKILKKDPNAVIKFAKPVIEDCPNGYAHPILFVFKRLFEEKRPLKFTTPDAKGKNGTLRSKTPNRKQQLKKEAEYKKSLKMGTTDAKVKAYTEQSSKKLKIAYEQTLTGKLTARTKVAQLARDAGLEVGDKLLKRLAEEALRSFEREIIDMEEVEKEERAKLAKKKLSTASKENLNGDTTSSDDDDDLGEPSPFAAGHRKKSPSMIDQVNDFDSDDDESSKKQPANKEPIEIDGDDDDEEEDIYS
ncbi:unnamed protein product [Cylindrotheca closterium]|uniref:Uncharacterized protein n=1 Tax=Cylindrotheca closterium TaxID=2856 RepID=A0AAD2FXQ3_9STRA|nr:unnamed protein product [Cylindrotheca closterium]